MVDDLGANEEEFKSSYILCISEEEPKGSYDKIQFSLVVRGSTQIMRSDSPLADVLPRRCNCTQVMWYSTSLKTA